MLNAALLRATLARIEANPDQWDQADWRCCFAGQTADEAGGQWLTGDPASTRFHLLYAEPEDPDHLIQFVGGVLAVTARARAIRLLGLDEPQALELFDLRNGPDDLRVIVDRLCAGGEVPDGR
jgi:DNA-binding GntR family transcriptional regulator